MAGDNSVARILLVKAAETVKRRVGVARERGEVFNIFRVLDRYSDEVKCHSAMIGYLADKKADHGQGRKFLNLFIRALNRAAKDKGIVPIDEVCPWGVKIEFPFTFHGEDGRIDILLESESTVLIIENKIFAKDQDRQVERYLDWATSEYNVMAEENGKRILLFYLSRHGGMPDDYSKGKKHDDLIVPLSYKDHISGWIDSCIHSMALVPPIRETLRQYHDVVLQLVGEKDTGGLRMELIELLLEGDNLAAALEIQKSIEPAKNEIRRKFWSAVKEQLKEKLRVSGKDLKFFVSERFIKPQKDENEEGIDGKLNPFAVKVSLKKLNELNIMYVLHYDKRDLYHGFVLADDNGIMKKVDKDDKAHQRIVGKFNEVFEGFNSSYDFIAWKYLDKKVDFHGFDEACLLVNKEERGNMVNAFVDTTVKTAVKTIEKYFCEST